LPQVSTPPLPALALVEERPLQKRPIAEENGNQLVETEESIRKRMRLTPITDNVQLEMASVSSNVAGSSVANGGVVSDNNLAPLLAYFGALIAQGERGAASVEILISSLTPDMLAELVIVNMQHLPSTAPPLPPGVGPGVSGGLAGLLSSSTPQSVPLPPKSVAAAETIVPSLPPQPQPAEVTRDPRRDPRRMDPWRVAATEAPTALLTPKLEAVEVAGVSNATTETVTVTVKIEGAAGSLSMNNRDPRSALQQYSISQPAVLPAVQVKQEPVEESGPLVSTPPLSPPDSLMEPGFSGPGIPIKSEPTTLFSTAAPLLSSGPQHGASGIAPQGIPVAAPIQPIPFVPLTEEQQTSLSKAALVRILEGHKTIAAAGGGDLRVALLARLVTQSCDDVEALEALQKHILADYQNHKGHEVALHVLYQLYAEQASNSSEIAASTTAAYDRFLLSVAQGLRDSLPSSDKSLSRLLGDAPLLPLTSLKLVEDLCNPEGGGEVPTGDRITQGLSALWSLILQRPPTRGTCLKMALKCTVHESDDVRAKAIRLVANKLYPLPYVAQTIEEFAVQSLLAVVDLKQTDTGQGDSMDVDSIKATQGTNGDQQSGNGLAPMDIAVVKDESQQNVAKSSPALSISDAQRCMSLFFALCTKVCISSSTFTCFG
jgi:symplekin